jgi:hypothetical protein
MDDVLFPGVTQGTLFVTDTPTNKVYEVRLTGLDPNTPIISLGDFGEVATVNPLTGVVETPLLTGLTAPHGLDFIPFAVPESSTWAMLLLGFAGLGYVGYRRARHPIALSTRLDKKERLLVHRLAPIMDAGRMGWQLANVAGRLEAAALVRNNSTASGVGVSVLLCPVPCILTGSPK